jgi:hypothetical protein
MAKRERTLAIMICASAIAKVAPMQVYAALAAPLGTFGEKHAFAAQARQNPPGRHEPPVLVHGGSEHVPHALRIIHHEGLDPKNTSAVDESVERMIRDGRDAVAGELQQQFPDGKVLRVYKRRGRHDHCRRAVHGGSRNAVSA